MTDLLHEKARNAHIPQAKKIHGAGADCRHRRLPVGALDAAQRADGGVAQRRGVDRLHRRGLDARCPPRRDRKSTRLNSSHITISYAVFCLKKKKKNKTNKIHTKKKKKKKKQKKKKKTK